MSHVKVGIGPPLPVLDTSSGSPRVSNFVVGPQVGPSLPVSVIATVGRRPPTNVSIVGVAAGSPRPSDAQILAGQNASGGAANVAISLPNIVAGLLNTVAIPVGNGNYDFYCISTDAGSRRSNRAVALSIAFAI